MNVWLKDDPRINIVKLNMVRLHHCDEVMIVILYYQLLINLLRVEFFSGDKEKIMHDMSAWFENRPGFMVKKMRMARKHHSNDVIVLVLYSQPEPEVC